jgi:co-chaperonin GroES (HSP10)
MPMSELLIAETLEPGGPVSVLPDTPEQKAKQLPVPATYHILCALPEIEETYESGLVKAGQTMQAEEVLTPVYFVVTMGPDCYKDKARFPSGASCKKGDFIIVRPNSGTRLKIHGREFRIITDDSVEATVEDPRGVGRAA